MAAIITEIPGAAVNQTDRRREAFRVKENGTITMIADAITIMAAETVAIMTMTMIVVVAEAGMRMEIADVTMNLVLIPVLTPDLVTMQAADATINNDLRTALSFWLTGRKGNVKLFFGTTFGE